MRHDMFGGVAQQSLRQVGRHLVRAGLVAVAEGDGVRGAHLRPGQAVVWWGGVGWGVVWCGVVWWCVVWCVVVGMGGIRVRERWKAMAFVARTWQGNAVWRGGGMGGVCVRTRHERQVCRSGGKGGRRVGPRLAVRRVSTYMHLPRCGGREEGGSIR